MQLACVAHAGSRKQPMRSLPLAAAKEVLMLVNNDGGLFCWLG